MRKGFKVDKITPLPSFDCTAYELTHEKTGAKYMHIDTIDTNNVFAIQFRTIPQDSTGILKFKHRNKKTNKKNKETHTPKKKSCEFPYFMERNPKKIKNKK